MEWDGDPRDWQPMHYEGKTYHAWNPLADDGDALKLAVKLEMRVNVVGYGIAEAMTEKGALVFENDSKNFDTAASTRRAIVRAAAAIGGAKP